MSFGEPSNLAGRSFTATYVTEGAEALMIDVDRSTLLDGPKVTNG